LEQLTEKPPHFYEGYFMIYDFVKANHHSSDPEWDGEPLEEFYAESIDLYGF
jgi:type I restriction enzyme R subunit